MVLKRIEAYGFKSFADKIELSFENSITAIVGPNGSGKSNVADALRWVLGEQNARNLRGAKMEDIIFNGSAKRKALNIADVCIVFDNTTRTFPIEFSEVALTRRMYRSGESEYYINKAPCRLKDILELLSGTGIGRDSMSIIGQNRADDILNSKPEERRLLFEEAAGIGKYKSRKKEAQRKLDDTNANITRIDDITAELENQLGPLRLAAAKTEEYNALFGQLRELKIDALAIKLRKLKAFFVTGKTAEQELSDELLGKENAILGFDADKEQVVNEISAVEEQIVKTEAKINELNLAYESGSGKIEVEKSRIILARERIEAVDTEQKRANDLRSDAQAALAALEDERNMLQIELGNAKTLVAEAENAARLAGVMVTDSENEIARLRDQSFSRIQQTTQIRNSIKMTQLEADNRSRAVARLNDDMARLEEELRVSRAGFKKLKQEQAVFEADLNQQTAAQEKLKLERQSAQLAVDNIRQQKNVLIAEINKLQIRKEMLENLQHNYEGFSRAAKAVLTATSSWRSKIYGAAGELVTARSEHALAIETALGSAAQNLVCENDAIARQAIEFLKAKQSGRVTLLPLANLQYSKTEFPKEKLFGILGRASEIVSFDPAYKRAVEFLLYRVLIADSFDNAIKTAKALNFSARIVTLQGELLSPGGAITGGSSQKQSSGIVSRLAEINELGQRLINCREKLKSVDEAFAVAERQLQVGDTQIGISAAGIQENQLRQTELLINLKHVQDTVVRLEQSLDADKKEQSLLASELAVNSAAVNALADELQTSEQQENSDQAVLTAKTAFTNQLRVAAAEAQEQLSARKIEQNSLIERFEHAKTRIADVLQTVALHAETGERLSEEKATLKNTVFRAETEVAAIGAQILEYRQDKAALNTVLARHFENKNACQTKLEALEKELRSIRRRISDIQARLSDVLVQNERCRIEIENVCERALDDFQIALEEYSPHREVLSPADSQTMTELDARIEALGTINPHAIDEFNRTKERFEFMNLQRNDLSLAQVKLLAMIAEMDEVMAGQFKEAVEQIDKFFGDIFVRLFGGGVASIVFTQPDNMLETGIEVVVQIPGKRRQNMTLLSGGERSLTVIALLFAMLQHRPSPFCVLDELDAALDEANVERFSEFIREYRERTQFILITHRKRTMEAAEQLHGVTMEETGVSQLVSVKFADSIA